MKSLEYFKRMNKILVTANKDLASPLIEQVQTDKLFFTPLELYEPETVKEENNYVLENFSGYAFIIHGNLRNARYFVDWINKNQKLLNVHQVVNLVLDEPTQRFLEENNIPGVMPQANARAIDLLEFMLRISKEGSSLYPTAAGKTEEMPGLLKELQMAVHEFTVCKEIRVSETLVKEYTQKIEEQPVHSILFHNRSSVIRTLTAFPEINYSEFTLIAGSEGAAQKMKEEGLPVHKTAGGSWKSIASIIEN